MMNIQNILIIKEDIKYKNKVDNFLDIPLYLCLHYYRFKSCDNYFILILTNLKKILKCILIK